ncbi:MAG: methyltransferase domain-containing protein, partial [Candidatus Kryptoniota bacterium]
MNKTWVFDQEHTHRFSVARQRFLSNFLPDLIDRHQLKTALDAGCGIGFFSNYLTNLGLKTTAFDGRRENIAEAKNRYPEIEFHVYDIENPKVQDLGSFDLVLCFGLLYHLENPFRAIRNLYSLTEKLLIIESIIAPSPLPIGYLVNECQGEDQGLHYVAFIPSETCLIKMLYRAGFPFVYKLTTFPDHEDFRETLFRRRRRAFLAASKLRLDSTLFKLVPEPIIQEQQWRSKALIRQLRIDRLSQSLRRNLPSWLYHPLQRLKCSLATHRKKSRVINLLGDRDIEWSWVTAQMPLGPGEALDFGPGGSYLGLIAAQRGFNVTAVDIEPVQWPYIHPQLHFVQGDILRLPLPKERFDLVINCSTVEHVGLVGRYGVTEDRPNGDLEAMARLKELMKPGGIMLLTIPVGQDAVFL